LAIISFHVRYAKAHGMEFDAYLESVANVIGHIPEEFTKSDLVL